MSVLDLQGMEICEKKGGGAKGSRTSKGCNIVNESTLSLTLCNIIPL
jgi:Lanthionine-containing peptide SapB precursor RamS